MKTCNFSSISKYKIVIVPYYIVCMHMYSDCQNLLVEASKQIGLINIYDIYDNCYMNLSSSVYSRTELVPNAFSNY